MAVALVAREAREAHEARVAVVEAGRRRAAGQYELVRLVRASPPR
jgi:hypothetical protein